jgi:hypothetical protein
MLCSWKGIRKTHMAWGFPSGRGGLSFFALSLFWFDGFAYRLGVVGVSRNVMV